MLRNITLSAEESLIEKARHRAATERQSLNGLFRQWMARYVRGTERGKAYEVLMQSLSHVKAGQRFSRDDLNER